MLTGHVEVPSDLGLGSASLCQGQRTSGAILRMNGSEDTTAKRRHGLKKCGGLGVRWEGLGIQRNRAGGFKITSALAVGRSLGTDARASARPPG